ncbi:MAG: flagellin, partial [Schwartzia sp.]|nr:flagellin [Schwartzia sp. (in: firmicutes)]
LTAAFMSDLSASGGGTIFLKDYCGIDLTNLDTGALTGKDAGGDQVKTPESVVPEAGSTLFWYFPNSRSSYVEGLEVIWPSPWQYAPKTVTFQVGTKANQAIKVGFSDMRAEGLGLKDKNGKTLSVATRQAATNAIHVIDQAITKALDQQTTIGALESRLEYTSSNLVLNSENTQSSESTIRDADMAREMAEYTKNNILLQGAQSMLAQANQNSSSVLSLLQ